MKRLIACILIILLLCLCGCGSTKDDVLFYYRQVDFQYGEQNGVILSESRNVSGHKGDLHFLLALYLVGPLDEALISPFPQETKLISAYKEGETVYVEISDVSSLSESEFSLGCACIALTCMDIENAQSISITSGSRSITLDQNSLLLYDDIAAAATEETQ